MKKKILEKAKIEQHNISVKIKTAKEAKTSKITDPVLLVEGVWISTGGPC